ncbi:MAG TPA: rhodanese-like domain-containing protein [Acidimicrobiia bacterium]|nr:rhodanese-like domain-containing protein [Acidimicrobiia bacterium]
MPCRQGAGIGLNLHQMIENVPAQDWESWIESNGGTVLDIREPFEWEQGTLPDSTLIPMGEIPERCGELDIEQAFLVVCRSGARSQQVAAFLTMNGFTRVANMAGGMKALGLQD